MKRLVMIVLGAIGGGAPTLSFAQYGHPPSGPVFSSPASLGAAEVGRTCTIAVRLGAPLAEDRGLIAISSDPAVLRVLGRADGAKGAGVVFVRVEGVAPGRALLAAAGKTVSVEVAAAREPPGGAEFGAVVSPAHGAAVWGKFAVSVEWFQERAAENRGVLLRVGSGEPLVPKSVTTAAQGPLRRAAFEVDATDLPACPLELRPVWSALSEGADQSSADSHGFIQGRPITVRVVHPSDADLASGEAEGPYEADRPERFKRPPAVSNDKAASGGKYVNNAGADGVVCFPLEVERPGWYQLIVTAAGDAALGDLPTIGVVIDGGQQLATNGRIADEKWHRAAIGVPFHLEAGKHLISPWFANDFAARKVDRNLRLDRIEVARVGGGRAAAPAADGDMSGAAPQPMTERTDQPMVRTAGQTMMTTGAPADGEDDFGQVPLQIALTAPLDGKPVSGPLQIEAWCTFLGADAPLVSLLLNGEVISTQLSIRPKFEIGTAALKAGENTLQLTAELGPTRASTLIQHITWAGPLATPDAPSGGAYYRFTARAGRWDRGTVPRIGKDKPGSEPDSIAFYAEATSTLALPDAIVGRFEVLLEARGEEFQGRPIAAVTLNAASEPTKVGEVQVPGRWDTYRVGEVDIPRGHKTLAVAFTNDKYIPKKDANDKEGGDRNLWVQAVVLRRVMPPNAAPPVVRVLYPPPSHPVWRQDAAVFDAADENGLATAELLIDGAPAGVARDVKGKPGHLVLPLIARDLSPGAHTLAIRVTNIWGKASTTEPLAFTIAPSPPREPGAYDRAITLLDRFAFGPDEPELAAILIMGEEPWLRDRLSKGWDDPGDRSAADYASLKFPNAGGRGNVVGRVLYHAMTTPNPVRARFVLWTENHFSTWIRKTEPDLKSAEHDSFAALGVAPFPDLLLNSARSPAMLRYLDQERSYAEKINENYAREIMELHTLGVHGGYTQEDVTTLATLLTGWTCTVVGDGHSGGEVRTREFRFEPGLSDGSPARLLGTLIPPTDPADRYDRLRAILETLAAHPSTASFICRKLAEHYIGAPTPDDLTADLASEFTRTGGDMAPVLLAMSRHPAFWSAPRRLAHPLDFALRLARTCDFVNPNAAAEFMNGCQSGLFDRPTPDGYPEADERYADSNAMRLRWILGKQAGANVVDAVPASFRTAKEAPQGWEQTSIDLMAIRLTGRLLGDDSNKALLDIIASTLGNRDAKIREAAGLLAAMPEANLR